MANKGGLASMLYTTTAVIALVSLFVPNGAAHAQAVIVSTDQTLSDAANPYAGIEVRNGAAVDGADLVIEQSSNRIGLLVSDGSATLSGGSITQSHATQSVIGARVLTGTASLSGTNINVSGRSDVAGLEVDNDSLIEGANLAVVLNSTASNSGSPSAGVYAKDGTARTSNSTFTISGTNSYGLLASGNSGRNPVVYSTNDSIVTSGASGWGVFAYSELDGSGRGTVYLDGGSVTTSGNFAYALLSQESNSAIHASNGPVIRTSGLWGIGAYAAWGGLIELANADIITEGVSGVGGYAANEAHLDIRNSRVETRGASASGMVADDASIALQGTDIITHGQEAEGVGAYSSDPAVISTVTLTGGSIRTLNETGRFGPDGTGARSPALLADGAGASISADGTQIETLGQDSYGALALDGATIRLQNLAISTEGFTAHGIYANGSASAITANNIDVTVAGTNAAAAQASSGGILTVQDTSLTSLLGDGVVVEDGSTAQIASSEITASGANARGILAARGSIVTVTGSQVSVTGSGGIGLLAQDGGTFSLDRSQVDVNGWAAAAQSGVNSFVLDGVTLTGAAGLLKVAGGSATTFSAAGSTLNGRIVTETGSALGVRLTDSTVWNMDGDSNVTGLLNSNSTILFATPGVGAFKTLTINGDYVGDGGTIVLNSLLGTDGSPSDRLHVEGGTSGNTNMVVLNAGGSGAQTNSDGIMVVQVDGASNGVFSLANDANQGGYQLQGRTFVAAGAFGYGLYQGGLVDPRDGNWYLRSGLASAPVVYAPSVPIYETLPQHLLELNGLGTLWQRVGNRSWGVPVDTGGDGSGTTIEQNGVWGRMEGTHSRFDPAVTTSGAGYKSDLWKVKLGVDGQFFESDAGRLIGGLTAHYGEARTKVDSFFGAGDIDTTGYGLGATLTWYEDSGIYIDAQAQMSWYDSDLTSRSLGSPLIKGNDGTGYALSLEGGKRIELSPEWLLTPQAQLIYSDVDFDSFEGPFDAQVSLMRGTSLKGRFGLAAEHQQTRTNDAGRVDRSSFYAIANIHYEMLDGTRVTVADSAGFGTILSSGPDRLWGALGLGGSSNWADDKYSLYGEVSANTSLGNFGDSYSLNGTVGFRVRW